MSWFEFEKFAETLAELSRREKEAYIMPDPDIDVYMKVSNLLKMDDILLSQQTFNDCCCCRNHSGSIAGRAESQCDDRLCS